MRCMPQRARATVTVRCPSCMWLPIPGSPPPHRYELGRLLIACRSTPRPPIPPKPPKPHAPTHPHHLPPLHPHPTPLLLFLLYAPEHAVGAAGQVSILDESHVLRAGKGNGDVAAKGGQGLRAARSKGGCPEEHAATPHVCGCMNDAADCGVRIRTPRRRHRWQSAAGGSPPTTSCQAAQHAG